MRIQEFDIVKGIAISCVVFAHALFFNFDKFSFASQNLVEIGTTMLAPVLAVFFFISGFLGYKSYAKRGSWKGFLSSRFKIILPPYLIWSTLYLILQYFLGQYFELSSPFNFYEILMRYLFGTAFLPFYYLFLLFVFYIFTPFLSNLSTKTLKESLPILFLLGILSSSFYFLPQYFERIWIQPIIAYRNPLEWIGFYVWGMYAAKLGNLFWRKKISPLMITMFILTYTLSSLEYVTVPKLTQDWESYLLLGPFAYFYFLFALPMFLRLSYIISKRNTTATKIFSHLGFFSLKIYMNHGLVLFSILGMAMLFYRGTLNEANIATNSIFGIVAVGICYEFSRITYTLSKSLI